MSHHKPGGDQVWLRREHWSRKGQKRGNLFLASLGWGPLPALCQAPRCPGPQVCPCEGRAAARYGGILPGDSKVPGQLSRVSRAASKVGGRHRRLPVGGATPGPLLVRGRPGASLIMVGRGHGVVTATGHILVHHTHRALILHTAEFLDLKDKACLSQRGASWLRGSLVFQCTPSQ